MSTKLAVEQNLQKGNKAEKFWTDTSSAEKCDFIKYLCVFESHWRVEWTTFAFSTTNIRKQDRKNQEDNYKKLKIGDMALSRQFLSQKNRYKKTLI